MRRWWPINQALLASFWLDEMDFEGADSGQKRWGRTGEQYGRRFFLGRFDWWPVQVEVVEQGPLFSIQAVDVAEG